MSLVTPPNSPIPSAPSARDEALATGLRLLFTSVVAACWAGMVGGAYFAEVTRRRLNAPPPQFIANPLEAVEARRQAEADARTLADQLELQRHLFARATRQSEAQLRKRLGPAVPAALSEPARPEVASPGGEPGEPTPAESPAQPSGSESDGPISKTAPLE